MQWYYQDEQGGQTPFDENYIAALFSENRIKSSTLVWNDTLSGWIPAAEAFPEAFPGISLPPSQPPAARQSPATTEAQIPPTTLTHSTGKVVNQELRELVKDFASYISANRFWMKLFGVLMIIAGAFQALTIVGLVIAWLPIWSGVLLLKAASSALVAESAGTVETLEDALYRIGVFFKINGITALVVVIIYAVVILGFLLIGGSGVLTGLMQSATDASHSQPF